MPTKDRKFTLKDYEELVGTKLIDYIEAMKSSIQQRSGADDLGELMNAQGNGEVPPGYHRMPNGEIMLDSEMAQ